MSINTSMVNISKPPFWRRLTIYRDQRWYVFMLSLREGPNYGFYLLQYCKYYMQKCKFQSSPFLGGQLKLKPGFCKNANLNKYCFSISKKEETDINIKLHDNMRIIKRRRTFF
jgi:hypothetical protein